MGGFPSSFTTNDRAAPASMEFLDNKSLALAFDEVPRLTMLSKRARAGLA